MELLNWLKLISRLFSKEKVSVLWVSSVWFGAQRWLIIQQYYRPESFVAIIRVKIGNQIEAVHAFEVHLQRSLLLTLEGIQLENSAIVSKGNSLRKRIPTIPNYCYYARYQCLLCANAWTNFTRLDQGWSSTELLKVYNLFVKTCTYFLT